MGFQPYGRMMNHPVLMKVRLYSASGVLYLLLTWGQRSLAERRSMQATNTRCLRMGWRASKGLLHQGDLSPTSEFQGWVLSCGLLYGCKTKQESLLIGRSPGERELQYFHQQLWFHCWDNHGEWVKIQAALSCWGHIALPEIFILCISLSHGGGESGVFVRSPVFLLSCWMLWVKI